MDSPGTLTWLIPKKEIFTQKISYTYPKKTNFSNKTIFHTFQICFKKPILHPKKTFLILIWKKESIYRLKKYFFVIKNNFPNKKLLILVWKNIVLFQMCFEGGSAISKLANLDTQITLPLRPRTNI